MPSLAKSRLRSRRPAGRVDAEVGEPRERSPGKRECPGGPCGATLPQMVEALQRNWNWRLSGHARLASLAGAWLLLFMASAPAAILFPLAALRVAGSPVQLFLNHRLGRRQPLEKRDWLDWALFAAAFLGSMAVSVLRKDAGGIPVAILLSGVLLPLSVIQLRATARSYRAHARTAIAIPAPAPLPFPALPGTAREGGSRAA